MTFDSERNQPFNDEPPDEFSHIFGVPNATNVIYPPGSHESSFGHQQNLSSGSHMPPYNGDVVVGVPYSQWPPHPLHHPNINPTETYDLNPVSQLSSP